MPIIYVREVLVIRHIDEIIAVVLVLGCLTLLLCGHNHEIKSILAMAAAWTFKGGYDRRGTPYGNKFEEE